MSFNDLAGNAWSTIFAEFHAFLFVLVNSTVPPKGGRPRNLVHFSSVSAVALSNLVYFFKLSMKFWEGGDCHPVAGCLAKMGGY